MTRTVAHRGYIGLDYDLSPRLVNWQTTIACGHAYSKCPLECRQVRHSNELSTDEGMAFIEDIAGFGEPNPILILSGGDPFERADIFDLIHHAKSIGLPVTIRVCPMAQVDKEQLQYLSKLGVNGIIISMVGANMDTQESCNGANEMVKRVLEIVEWTRDFDLPIQIETHVRDSEIDQLAYFADLIEQRNVSNWKLIFVNPAEMEPRFDVYPPEQFERVLTWLYHRQDEAPFSVTPTAAPHYFRVADHIQGMVADQNTCQAAPEDGNGYVFINAFGEVYPSEFLPLRTDNVRRSDITSVYRDAELFKHLRKQDRLQEPCLSCPYVDVCGGSRSRAFAMKGNPLASDPLCLYAVNSE